MKNSDIATFYVVFVLPAVSGIVLFIEGTVKLLGGKKAGLVSLFFSLLFIGAAVIAYFVLSKIYNPS